MKTGNDYHTTPAQLTAMYKELDDAQANAKSAAVRGRIGIIAGRVGFLLVAGALCFILISVWVAKFNGNAPTVLGYQFYSVQTASMDPTLPVGSVILAKKLTDDTDVDIGDIIVFRYNGSFITHRVLEYYTDDGTPCYRTKGDNPQNSIDPWTLHREDIEAVFLRKLW